MWVLIGAAAAVLVFLAHLPLAHNEEETVENGVSRNQSL